MPKSLLLLALVMLNVAAGEAARGIHRETVLSDLPGLVLAEGGKAKAEIVVLAPASAVARFAARELKTYLDQATGADFPLRNARSGTVPAIIIGNNPWLRGWGIDTTTLPRDGFSLRRVGALIVIAGRDDPTVDPERNLASGYWGQFYERGSIFAVYHFLERFLGIRFYFPGELGTVVPHHPELMIPAVMIDESPDFSIREMSWNGQPWFGGADDKTVVRMQNLQRLRLRGATALIPNCHGLARLGLAERFASSHPEYFALLSNNKRDNDLSLTGHHGHLCFSDPGLADQIFRDARAFLLGQPASAVGVTGAHGQVWDLSAFQPGYFNIMPQDGHSSLNFCRCAACAPRYDAGKASDVVWDFVAQIANRLQAAQIPGEITAMAYSACLPVPETDIPSNVRVMVALSGPWSERDPAVLANEMSLIDAWTAKLGRRVWLWNYLNNYAGQIPAGVPSLAPRCIAAYYRRVAGKIDGAFVQSEVDSFLGNYLNWTVALRCLWNTSTDVESLLEEHHRLMFGAGAEPMHALHDLLEERWMTRGLGQTFLRADGYVTIPPSDVELWQKIYDDGFIAQLDRLAEKALALSQNDGLCQKRIRLITDELLGTMKRVRDKHIARESDVASQVVTVPPRPPELAITLDGRIDEPAWDAATAVSLVPLKDQPASVHTCVKILWDADTLYLGFDCEEPRPAELSFTARPHDDVAVWQDSSVEIFLDPTGLRQDYRQLIVNPAGSLSDASMVVSPSTHDWGWDSKALVKTTISADRWWAEVAIPGSALGAEPLQAGRRMVANFNRSRNLKAAPAEENQLFSWSPYLVRGFHGLPQFGSLILANHKPAELLHNGGFESLAEHGLPRGWKSADRRHGRIHADEGRFREGRRSLRIDGGEGAIQLTQELPALNPAARYRLSFMVRAENLAMEAAEGGVSVLILNKGVLTMTRPSLRGSFAWSRQVLDFTAPAQGQAVSVRISCLCPSGQVWLDAFKLEQMTE